MKFVAHVTLKTGDMARHEEEASCSADARAKAIAHHPLGAVASVSAWPVRGSREMQGEVRQRIASPAFDSAFGALC